MNKSNKTILALDIGSSQIVSVLATSDNNKNIDILGFGKAQSEGIEKGNITDMILASNAISDSVLLAKSSYDVIDETYVSVSGIDSKSVKSKANISIFNGHITSKDIKQVFLKALQDIQDYQYEVIHCIPIHFRVDDSSYIDNPLNINATKLEVYVNIIMIKKSILNSISEILRKTNLHNIHYVLNSYATALATADIENKQTSTMVINLGATTTEFAVLQNRAIVHNDIIAIGSKNLTNDISLILKTSKSNAEDIKKKHSTLLYIEDNQSYKIKVPFIGNEAMQEEITLEYIQKITHARVEEIFVLIHNKIQNSSFYETLNTIVLTGGMSKLPGIIYLARAVFASVHIQVKAPKNFQNGYINFNDPRLSSLVGLIMYGLETEYFCEFDSNKNLKGIVVAEKIEPSPQQQELIIEPPEAPKEQTNRVNSEIIKWKNKILEWI